MEVIIAGAGIGGLSAALFLASKGVKVRVFDAVQKIEELGVGINIQPHAIRELEKIELDRKVLAAGNPCLEWALFNRFGQEIWREPRGTAAGHGWPQVSIHRGKLQKVLLDVLIERIGSDRLITNRRLVGFEQSESEVTAHFEDADGTSIAETGAVLIGADGIHSTVRRHYYPKEGDPIFSGALLWRGITKMKPFFGGNCMTFAGYKDQKLISYPITTPDSDGLSLMNWIAEIHADKMLNREDWNRKGRREDILPLYEQWEFPWLNVPDLIRNAQVLYEYPMIDRDPLLQWSFGRVSLLGDAAHAMYPIGANGASQAIRDASALADAFAQNADPEKALKAYETERLDATTQIVLSNRKLGPEQVMQIAHERAPNGFKSIDDVISREELEAISARYRTITWADKTSSKS